MLIEVRNPPSSDQSEDRRESMAREESKSPGEVRIKTLKNVGLTFQFLNLTF